jgi:hypothetical protein
MMSTIAPWNASVETFSEYVERKNKAENAAREARKKEALFRLALSGLRFERYTIAVEHGDLRHREGCGTHAYVLCLDCWKQPPGLVDPRVVVLGPAIKEWLNPGNEDLAVGARMPEALKAMVQHEQERHGGKSAL